MHYDARRRESQALQLGYTAFQNPGGGPAPPGMEERHRPSRCNQVDRDAVRDGDKQEHARIGGDVPIDALDEDPAGAGDVPYHRRSVYLVTQDEALKSGFGGPERGPPAHHLANRLPGPETEIETRRRAFAASGDPRDDAVPAAPLGEGIPGNGTAGRQLPKERRISRQSVGGPRRAPEGARRCARTRARSGRYCGWCSARRRRARRAASPCPRGCQANPPRSL